jgi:hypothetical protein
MRRALLVLLVILGLGALAWYLSTLAPTAPALPAAPASPVPTSAGIFPPGFWTYLYTAFHPMCLALILLLIATGIALWNKKWGAAGALVAVTLAVYAIDYWFLPSPTCASDDLVCIQARQEAAATIAQQKANQLRLQYEQQQARFAAAVPDSRHCDSIKTPRFFDTKPGAMPVNAAGQCDHLFWHAGHCIYVRLAGKTEPEKEQICDGKGAFIVEPDNVEDAWSADTPFNGYVQLNPPRYQTGNLYASGNSAGVEFGGTIRAGIYH